MGEAVAAGDAVLRKGLPSAELALVWQVVRWTWADLLKPWRIADRLHRAFARSARVAPVPLVRPRTRGGHR